MATTVAKNSMNLLSCDYIDQKSDTSLIGLKSRCWQGYLPFGSSVGKCIPHLSSFWRPPKILGFWPFLVSPHFRGHMSSPPLIHDYFSVGTLVIAFEST